MSKESDETADRIYEQFNGPALQAMQDSYDRARAALQRNAEDLAIEIYKHFCPRTAHRRCQACEQWKQNRIPEGSESAYLISPQLEHAKTPENPQTAANPDQMEHKRPL